MGGGGAAPSRVVGGQINGRRWVDGCVGGEREGEGG